jgi:hypothetical protein
MGKKPVPPTPPKAKAISGREAAVLDREQNIAKRERGLREREEAVAGAERKLRAAIADCA